MPPKQHVAAPMPRRRQCAYDTAQSMAATNSMCAGRAGAPLAPPSELAQASPAAEPHLQTAWEVRSATRELQAPLAPFAASRTASVALVHARQQRFKASAPSQPCNRRGSRTGRRRLGQQAGIHGRVFCARCGDWRKRASIYAVGLAGRSADDAHTRPCHAGSPRAGRAAALQLCCPQTRRLHLRRSSAAGSRVHQAFKTATLWQVRAWERGARECLARYFVVP